jgi:hypothetical protein
MDVWRYSDWGGFQGEVRYSQKHIWRWRDWIVESLIKDKGYDRMVLEMLAGDELAPTEADTVRATGFLARNYFKFNRNTWLENAVEHTGKAFLGITLNCARCHNHKFDPFSQEEYYQFRAFFEPYNVRIDQVPGEVSLDKDGLPRVFDGDLKAPTYLFRAGNEADPDKSKTLTPGVPAALGGANLRIEPVPLPPAAHSPSKRAFVIKDQLAASNAEIGKARDALAAAAAKAQGGDQKAMDALALAEIDVPLAEAKHAALEAVLAVERFEDDGKAKGPEWEQAARNAHDAQGKLGIVTIRRALTVAKQGQRMDAAAFAAQVAALEKQLNDAEAAAKMPPALTFTPRVTESFPKTSSGRRLALARWIVSKDNPLAARVAVNHIWLRHFGAPLVGTVFDFGKHGQPPTHPALLDWLAVEFMERGWNMKRMHRLMVTSTAYRMDSSSEPAAASLDPDNRLLWRMNVRRMEAETVRDSLLFLAGQLDPKMGGPEIDHAQGMTVPRRSLYFQTAPDRQMEFLELFDGPSVDECYRRTESLVPQQGFALANSPLALGESRRLAATLSKEIGEQATRSNSAAFVRAAFAQVLGRAPTTQEASACEDFLKKEEALLVSGKLTVFTEGPFLAPVPPSPVLHLRARQSLVHVLFNHNEFVTIR